MTFLDKLDALMRERNISRRKLAIEADIPYSTVVGFYEKGYDNIKLSTLKKLAKYLRVSIDFLCDDHGSTARDTTPAKSDRFNMKYIDLSENSQRIVDLVIEELIDLASYKSHMPDSSEHIREYYSLAATGYASPVEGEDFDLIPRDGDIPRHANFSVKISNDSMEPYVSNGTCVYAVRTNELTHGDVGIFLVDGNVNCKQYYRDHAGNIYLFSVNRLHNCSDMIIAANSGVPVFCFGQIILPQTPPLPEIKAS